VSDDNQNESTAIQAVLEFKEDIDQYVKDRDRTALVTALKDQFLAHRHYSASKTEQARQLAAEILLSKIPNMSDNMLIRVIEVLAKVGEIDMQALVNFSPGGKGPLLSINQVIGGSSGASLSSTGSTTSRPGENPVRGAGQVLEALEHLTSYLANRAKNEEMKMIEGEVTEGVEEDKE
jgi:hypothetical protein